MTIRSQNQMPLPPRPERLFAALRLESGNNIDAVIPAWVAVVDEAYPQEVEPLFETELYGPDSKMRATAAAALAEAGFTVGEWTKHHDKSGRHLGWRVPVERT